MVEETMKMWEEMTRATISSEAFSAASNATLDWTLFWQKQWRNQSAQMMDAMEFPKRSDLARLSKQVLAAESRVAACEEQLEEVNEKLDRVLAALKTLGRGSNSGGSGKKNAS